MEPKSFKTKVQTIENIKSVSGISGEMNRNCLFHMCHMPTRLTGSAGNGDSWLVDGQRRLIPYHWWRSNLDSRKFMRKLYVHEN